MASLIWENAVSIDLCFLSELSTCCVDAVINTRSLTYLVTCPGEKVETYFCVSRELCLCVCWGRGRVDTREVRELASELRGTSG